MNELFIKTRSRPARKIASVFIAFAAALAVSPLIAQAPAKQKQAPAEWPESAPYDAAIEAFDAALTRAGWDLEFRQRLIKSPDSAKEAVAEVGNITIPASKVIVFYEAEPAKPDAAKSATVQDNAYTFVQLLSQSKSNENVHVFCLPSFKKGDKSKKYKYEKYFMCCYDVWKRQNTRW
ncbi:MAG TPA: hypothetical protein VGQ95_12580 [Chthoniobacterales bacterium]|nr:hypothetical protein [Chthoniobacterales bacterium]